MSKRLFFLFFYFLCFAVSQEKAFAQESCELTLKGEVLETDSHLPVPFATINVVNGETFTQADDKGIFELKLNCDDQFELQVSQFDYLMDTVLISLEEADKKINIYLKPKKAQLEAVTVHAHQERGVTQSNLTEIISSNELKEQTGLSLSEQVAQLPGVFNITTGPGINKPMIQGLYGGRIQVINNEVAQMGQQWGTDHAPEIDPFSADNIQVIKGAAAIKYGPRAIGGAMLVYPEDLAYDSTMHGKINLTGISNGMGAAGAFQLSHGYALPKNGSSINWRFQGSAKKIGDRQTADYNLTNTGSEEWNYSLASNFINHNYQIDLYYSSFRSKLGILRGAHVGNVDDLLEAIDRRPPFFTQDFSYAINSPRQFVNHQLLKSKIHFDWNKVGEVNLIYAYQQNMRQEYDIRRDSDDDRPNMDLQLNSHVIKADLDHLPMRGTLEGHVGVDIEQASNFTASNTGSPPLIPNYSLIQGGVYLSEHYAKGKWLGELGVRYDYQNLNVLKFDSTATLTNPMHQFGMLSTVLGLNYLVNKRFQLRSNLSFSERAPNISELYSQGLHHSIAAIELGNSNLKKEQIKKAAVSLIYKTPERLKLEGNFYFNAIDNYIFLQPDGVETTIRGAFLKYSYQQTDAALYGMDLKLDIELIHHLLIMSQLSMVRGTDKDLNAPLIFMPADRFKSSLFWRVDNVGQIDEIKLRLTAEQVFKQHRTPESERFPLNDNTLFPVPEAYFLVNSFVSFTKNLADTQLNCSVSVNNLFNMNYVDYLNRLRYYAESPGRNIEIRINYIF